MFLLAAIAALAIGADGAQAAAYPDRTVHIVVGQTAGATSDTVARIVADLLADEWRIPIVVDNRPGAGGTIAADIVAKAPADGYTLLVGGQSNLAIAAVSEQDLRYNPITDFVPIGRVARAQYFIVVSAVLPVKSIPELIAHAHADPGRLTYVSFGGGTLSRLAFELLKKSAGIDLTEIPYKGSAPAVADLLAGRVDMSLNDLPNMRQHADAGKVRVIAAAGAQRSAALPDLPTVAEQGLPGYAIDAWYGLVAPAGLPANVAAALRDALAKVQRSPAFRNRVELSNLEPIREDAAQFATVIRDDIDRFAQVLRRIDAATPVPAVAR